MKDQLNVLDWQNTRKAASLKLDRAAAGPAGTEKKENTNNP
jgi:hypothetical protein